MSPRVTCSSLIKRHSTTSPQTRSRPDPLCTPVLAPVPCACDSHVSHAAASVASAEGLTTHGSGEAPARLTRAWHLREGPSQFGLTCHPPQRRQGGVWKRQGHVPLASAVPAAVPSSATALASGVSVALSHLPSLSSLAGIRANPWGLTPVSLDLTREP